MFVPAQVSSLSPVMTWKDNERLLEVEPVGEVFPNKYLVIS